MTVDRWKFLKECSHVLCSGLPCSCCPMENFCQYDEDVYIEGYVPDIVERLKAKR